MARHPAKKPEAVKAAPATQSPGAVTGESESSSGADTQAPPPGPDHGATGGAEAPPADPGASSLQGASGDDTASEQPKAPPADPAAGGHVELAAVQTPGDLELAGAVFDIVELTGLSIEELGSLSDDSRARLVSMVLAVREQFEAAAEKVRAAAHAMLAGGDLFDIEARSRDGQPFRRAGFKFGATWQKLSVTVDQLQVLEAERAIQLRMAL